MGSGFFVSCLKPSHFECMNLVLNANSSLEDVSSRSSLTYCLVWSVSCAISMLGSRGGTFVGVHYSENLYASADCSWTKFVVCTVVMRLA